MIKCKHRFRTIREGDWKYSDRDADTIVQCDKCLGLFSIDRYNKIEEIREETEP